MPTRNDLKELSEHKLKIIKCFFMQKEYDEVVQNSGYVIEFGLKSAICKHEDIDEYPCEQKYLIHNLTRLIKFANLQEKFDLKKTTSADFFANWSLITTWTPQFRYQPIGTSNKEHAKQVINAIDQKDEGVFPWVKSNW